MAETARVISMDPEQRLSFVEVSWKEVSEPGAYVERGTGDLYRIPAEGLIPGCSPAIRKESLSGSHLVQISKDPFITTLQARMLACEYNLKPNF